MPLPAILEVAHSHLFSSRDEMTAAGLPAVTIRHLERLRDIYNYWVAFPSKRDRDIVAALRARYGIGDTVARQDLRVIKTLLGDLQRVSRDYMRYRVTVMLEDAYASAKDSGDARGMVSAAKALADAHQLDKDDDRSGVLDSLLPVALTFTDDPEVIGIPRMPNHREAIRKMKERYATEQTEYVEFEDIDFNEAALFTPKQPQLTDADKSSESIS